MSLAHHTQLLRVATLGITDFSYFRSPAGLTRPVMDEAMVALQQHGIMFLESLVLRTALHARCRTSAPHVEPHANISTLPWDVTRRCSQSSGSRSATSQLDADSYTVFERTLSAKDLMWVDSALLLKAEILEHVCVLA